MTAICTNGEIGSGGFYFMISRSLGPETGAMFGILYFLTNAIMVSFSIVGICEEINYILQVWKLKIILMMSSIFINITLIDTKHWNSRESVSS
jgi:solute carrier family 12 sodium/potassium/chloride transporter 2